MGLFGTGKGKKRIRSKNKTAKEKLDELKVKHLKQMQRDNPARFNELMEREIEKDFGPPKDRLTELVEGVQQMRDMGFDPMSAGEGNDMKDFIKAVLTAVPAVLGMRQPPPSNITVTNPNEPGSPQIAPPQQPQLEQPKMTWESQIVIEQLSGKSPEEAAAWLMQQRLGQGLVKQIATCPDDNIPQLMDALAKEHPEFGPLLSWLRQQPDWFVATVREIRRQSTEASDMGM